ncbi:MAG: AMP-binding protein [Hyphomicrobiaceae bacterium]
MIEIDDGTTIGDAFVRAAAAYASHEFLVVPVNPQRSYHAGGYVITYRDAAREVERLAALYRAAGYGHGHRVAMLLENRPEHFLHKLALNAIGVSCVPINPDYRAAEIAYLLAHSKADMALAVADRRPHLEAGLAESGRSMPLCIMETLAADLRAPARPADASPVTADSEASILYTSGTTGRPKGCVLSHAYELACGDWYARLGGMLALRDGDRVYNPLPLYHVNSGILSFYGLMLSGNCQIQPDRFSPQRWWQEVAETRATVIHYLGVVAPLLLGQPPAPHDRQHGVRFGLGAGIEPQLHAKFEERFGFPMVEVWGMTEMVRILSDSHPPRQVGTRAFGRAVPGVEARVVDAEDRDVPDGEPGELVIRHCEATPRRHFFSGYLDDEDATRTAWRNGWFHTGDTVWRGADGMLHFVDRKKNIIRRAGENIAAAEIEALLQAHPLVKQVAVLAAPDPVREEEVLACIVLHDVSANSQATADTLFEHCFTQLAYFKAPGWIYFTPDLPTTGTQKIQKHQIFPAGSDFLSLPGMFDLRARKKR